MTCEEFERVVTDLACEFLIEAASRKRGLAHARACSRCASRLQRERRLTAMLSEVSNIETVQAPGSTRNSLLAAFQDQHGQTPVPADASGVAVPLRTPLRTVDSRPQRRPLWLMAAAAALALLALTGAWELSHRSVATPSGSTEEAGTPGNGVAVPAPGSSVAPPDAAPGKVAPAATGKSESPRTFRRRLRPVFRPEMARVQLGDPRETVTDFLPLTAIAEKTDIPTGTIMRVELPRASLLAMGFPMNVERGAEMIKADIVVGDDGLARAIRLVY
jgi:hypothetical protein